MKKFFFLMVAAVAMLAVSCSKEDNGISNGNDFVTFKVTAPELATRAIGDGTTAQTLHYAVYDAEWNHIATLDGTTSINITADVQMELLDGKVYNFIFWAQNDDAPYTFDAANKKMTVDYAGIKANNENLDAFYATVENLKVQGGMNKTVELFRPFAQLNVGTLDWNAMVASGETFDKTKVKVKAYDTLDFVSGGVSGLAERTFNLEVMPTESLVIEGKTESYKWLAMNYLLVNEKELVKVTFNANNSDVAEKVWNNVPVQRNYRTNIVGKLLTSPVDFEIVIKPAFKDEFDSEAIEVADGVLYNIVEKTYTLTSAAGLKWFAEQTDGVTRAEVAFDTNGGDFKGYKVVLGADIDLAGQAWTPIASGSKTFFGTFDGNGKTISNLKVTATDKSPVGLFAKSRGEIKNVTVKNVDIVGHYKAGAIVGDGLCSRIENCHVEGGQIIITPLNEDDGNHAGGIVGYLSAEPTAWVKDCSVKNLTVSAYRDVAGLVGTVTGSKAAVVTNGKVENVTVIADQSVAYKEDKAFNAGEIVGRNIKGVDLSSCKATNVTIKNVVNNDVLNVVLKQNFENINVVLAEDATVDVYAWENGAFGGDKTKSIAIDGNGHKLTFNQTNSDWNNIVTANGAKLIIKNATLTNAGHNDGPWNRHDLNFACDVELDNVVSDKAIALKAGGLLNEVTINDKNTSDTYALWIQPNGQTVTLTECVIDMLECSDGRGIKIDEQYVSAPEKVTLNVSKTVFKTEEKAAILVKSKAGAEVNVSEIDITAVAADAEFAVWVDEASKAYADLVVVNGAKVIVEGTVVAETADSLVEALENGEDVLLTEDVKIDPAGMSNAYGTTGINVKNGQTIDGGGHTLDIQGAGGTWDSGISTTGGLIKNITITGSFRGVFVNHNSTHSEKVVLNNVIIDGTTYTISCDQGTGKGLEAKDSVFKGWTSYAGTLGEASFTNCQFGRGNGYAYCRPYAPTKFVGCDFEAGFTVDPRAAVEFENCTFGGVALTADNIADLVTNTSKVTVK